MTGPLSHPLPALPDPGDWMQDRLSEARGILADAPHHRDTLVILACRTIVDLTDDADERQEARDLWRLLDPRSLQATATAAAAGSPGGGA